MVYHGQCQNVTQIHPIQNSQRNQPYSMIPNHKQPTNLIIVTMQEQQQQQKNDIFNHNRLQLTIINPTTN